MKRLAIAAAVVATLGLSLPAGAAEPPDTVPEEWLGELADARTLLETLEDSGTSAAALAPAEDALECWAMAGSDALACRDTFFARVVDATSQSPGIRHYALNQTAGVDLWMD